jgi:Holliday junction resolvase RusA-like endonuclease
VSVRFTVIGTPAPQGSKTRWGTEDNPNTRPWRAAVAASAHEAARNGTALKLLPGPLTVRARFYFPRPKSHYRTGRFAGTLKDSAPLYCATTPDLDKLQRAIGDALKGVLLHDDSQIVQWHAAKFYGAPARAEITIEGAS